MTRNFIPVLLFAAVLISACGPPEPPDSTEIRLRPNILFVAVDDLRPEIGAYGASRAITPNIDRLAAEGVLFERAYVQVPVCGASRASMLTGMRPTRSRFVTYYTNVDEDAPDIPTLPEYLKDNGYITIGNGKIFHQVDEAPRAWSEPAWRLPGNLGNWRDYILDESIEIAATHDDGRGPAYERFDVPDTAYIDGKTLEKSLDDLRRLAAGDSPFFLAVGFLKPHLPFNVPERYWAMYDPDTLAPADNMYPPEDAPAAALHNWGELRSYHGVPRRGPLSEEMARTMVHGYLAATSQADEFVGRLLSELAVLGIEDETIVVLWGDHGWQLGEHGLWCKHSNFETSLRAPLIVRVAGGKSGRVNELVEFIDVYPTLIDLAGLRRPAHLDGKSLEWWLTGEGDPPHNTDQFALSRYHDGESIRTDRYRYTEWKDSTGVIYARALFDHKEDPAENVNVAERPALKAIVSDLSAKLAMGYPR